VDDLVGTGEHELRLHWLLPDLPVEVSANVPYCAAFTVEKVRFRWNIFSSSPGSAAVIRGGKKLAGDLVCKDQEVRGWESPTYGERSPAISLLYCVRAYLPIRLVTAILAGDALQFGHIDGNLALSRQGSEVYRVSLSPARTAGVSG
jgi:hypothetical protein